MSAIAQSVSWWCFTPRLMLPEEFVRAAAAAGFTALDLVPPEHWEMVQAQGMTISSVQGHVPLEVGLNQRALHAQLEAAVQAKLEQAARFNIPNVLCFSGNRNGLSDAAGAEAMADSLARLAPAAEDARVTLVIELLNSKVDHADYQADHTAWGAQVCAIVGSPRVKLLYDIYHMQIMEGDVMRTIRTYHQHIGHYHTGGNPGRNDLDDEQELYYPAILRAIRDTGFSGYVAHEFLPKGEPAAALRAAFELCAPHL